MKKILFIMPLMAISLLASCGGKTPDPTYTITFKNDGDEDKKIENIKAGSIITENIPTPITPKPDSSFIGWCTDNESKNLFDFDTVKIYQDYTLYSGWKRNEPVPIVYHTITFDAGEDGKFINGDQTISFKLESGTKILPYIRAIQPISKGTDQLTKVFYYYKHKGSDDLIDYDDIITNDITFEAEYLPLPNDVPWTYLPSYDFFDWKMLKLMAVTNPTPEKCVAIGALKEIKINGKEHQIKIIDFNHDDLVNGGKAAVTFEFFNLITEEEGAGNACKTIWDNKIIEKYGEDYPLNYDFPNSVLNDLLNVGDDCIFNMLPDDLKAEGIIEEVKKLVTQWGELNTYNTKLFPLASSEMTDLVDGLPPKNEGEQYEYWINNNTDDKRKKNPVAGGSDSYWLRSPDSIFNAAYVGSSGQINTDRSLIASFAVAPAFCI